MSCAHSIDHLQLYKYFHLPCTVVDTDGIGTGVIVKFVEFYLKIYEDDQGYSYTIHWYHYGESMPFHTDHVGQEHFHRWVDMHNL